jgi:2-polyprenyl-6-methoxyphenol hydroxylase-like FAD-dependent oxidoreductase
LSDVPGLADRDRQSLNFTFGHRGFFGYGGARPDEVMWWSNLWREKELTEAELNDLSIDAVKREMLSIYRGYHDPIEKLITHTGPPVKLNVYDIQTLPAWYKGRVVLIGDAAHAVSPNAGQGASMALEDAMYLAKVLCEAQGDHERAFERFERERKPRVERIVAEGRRRGSDPKSATPFECLNQHYEIRCSRSSSICSASEARIGSIGTESYGKSQPVQPETVQRKCLKATDKGGMIPKNSASVTEAPRRCCM